MRGCDTPDQLMSYYSFLQKSIKWWKELFIHLLNMLLLNVHILNSKYGCKKLDHQAYMEYIANYLITEGSANCSLKRPTVWCHSAQNDIQGTIVMPMNLHLPQLIPRTDGSKRKPSWPSFACDWTSSDIQAKRIPERCTGIWCGTCKKKTTVHNSMFWNFSHWRKLQSNTSRKEIFNIEKWASIKFHWCNTMQKITNLWPLSHFIMIMINRHENAYMIWLSVMYKCVPTSCSINNDIPSKWN